MLVVPAEGGADSTGEAFLSAVKAQGMPSVLFVLQVHCGSLVVVGAAHAEVRRRCDLLWTDVAER